MTSARTLPPGGARANDAFPGDHVAYCKHGAFRRGAPRVVVLAAAVEFPGTRARVRAALAASEAGRLL